MSKIDSQHKSCTLLHEKSLLLCFLRDMHFHVLNLWSAFHPEKRFLFLQTRRTLSFYLICFELKKKKKRFYKIAIVKILIYGDIYGLTVTQLRLNRNESHYLWSFIQYSVKGNKNKLNWNVHLISFFFNSKASAYILLWNC